MKQFPLLRLAFILAFSINLLSCSKDGEPGPPGDTGATGGTGPAGPAGPQGPAGAANVKVDTFSITSSQYLYNSIFWTGTSNNVSQGQISRYFVRPNTTITEDILAKGMVLVFFLRSPSLNTNAWTSLPYSATENFSGTYSLNWGYDTEIGKITLHFFFAKIAGGTPPTLSTYTIQTSKYKVITVEGNLIGKANFPDKNDYPAVCKFLGIPE